jgi:hypothetical protein
MKLGTAEQRLANGFGFDRSKPYYRSSEFEV